MPLGTWLFSGVGAWLVGVGVAVLGLVGHGEARAVLGGLEKEGFDGQRGVGMVF